MGSLGSSSSPMSVSLRKLTAADVKASAKCLGDDEVTFTTPNNTLRSDEELERYFAATVAPHPWYRLICVNGVPAGAIYLTMGANVHAVRGDLSYILATEIWGKGVVTQATKLAEQAGFQEFDLARIQAFTMITNIESQRVLEKCGFQRERCCGTLLSCEMILLMCSFGHLPGLTVNCRHEYCPETRNEN